MSEVFDHIISLGSDCEVSLHLRRIGWLQTPSVFDWLVTPWDAMMGVLCDNGERLATSVDAVKEGTAAACGVYGLLYWHEFSRDRHGRVEITEPAVLQVRQKLLHKMARMRSACMSGRRVLFIRAGIATDAPDDRFGNGAIFRVRELDRCASILSDLYPSLRFSLLLVDYDGHDRLDAETARDPRIVRYSMAPKSNGCKHASESAWETMLSVIPYRPHAPSCDDELLPA